MIFVELYAPCGVFSEGDLRELAGRLTIRELLTHVDAIRDVLDASEGSSVNPGVMDFVDSVNHVVVHEIGTWIVGGRALSPGEPPRYVARVYVPGPWRKALSAFLIAGITRALSQPGTGPRRSRREPDVEVYVVGVPEGGYGASGRVVGQSALLDMISEAKTAPPVPGGPGVLIDPVCGMAASDMVTTLEHEGTTYGFCCPGCRRHFAGKLAAQAGR